MIHVRGGVWKHLAVPWPHVGAALMHSQTPTWLNSINPQRSLAIFIYLFLFFPALTLAPLLRLVLQRHHCVMLAYKRGWTLTGSCPGDFNHSPSAGARPAVRAARPLVTGSSCLLALSRLLLTAAAEEAAAAAAAAWLLNSETLLHKHPCPHPPYPVLMTNQNEKWRRGRAWFVLHAKYGL